MQYTTMDSMCFILLWLFYLDFKDTFVCNTQHILLALFHVASCFIKISKILLYAIHNSSVMVITILPVVLSGFQRYFCMQYITVVIEYLHDCWLCYQDFKDTFVCNTQLYSNVEILSADCVIRISMNNLSAKVQKTYEICKFI